MGRLRKLILLLFVGVYFVVAPLTVLYALGYLFNPVQQTLYQTGLISLDSEPAGADVWVNGSPVKDKTPLVLRNLKPGMVDIRVSHAGRQPWHRQIEVKPERAVRLENILLFPLSFEPEVLGDFPLSKIWVVPGGKYLLVLQRDRSVLQLFDLEEKKFRPVFSYPYPPKAKVEDVFIHPSGDQALGVIEIQGRPHPTLVKFTDPIQSNDLTDFFSESFSQLKWSLYQKNSVFYLSGEMLRRLDLERGVLYPARVKRVLGYALQGRRLFVLDGRRRFLELNEKGKTRDTLLNDPAKARLIFGPARDEHYSIFFLPKSSVFSTLNDAVALFLSENGRLSSNKLPYFLDEDLDELSLALTHPRVAYAKANELWAIDFERERKKEFFENGPRTRRLYQGKDPLAHLLWFYNDQYVLFSERNQLKVQDIEGEGEAIKLMKISSRVRETAVDARKGILYFAEPEGDRLARVKLFEKPGLLPRIVDDWVEGTRESQ